MHKIYFLIVLFISTISSSVFAEFDQTVLLVNGKIYTVNEEQPLVEAISIKRGKIDAIGSNEKILKKARAGTQVIDLKGRTVVPGFIDAHGNMQELGEQLMQLDLSGVQNPEQLIEKVQTHAKSLKPGSWIVGRGWDHRIWNTKRYPDHKVLSLSVPDNPVMLFHADKNTCLVNANAMDLAGITVATPNPVDGVIFKVKQGGSNKRRYEVDESDKYPSGILIGEAIKLVSSQLPEKTERQAMRTIRKAAQHCAQQGITSVHDFELQPESVDIYKKLIDETKFYFRIYGVLDANGIDTSEAFSALVAEKPLIGYGQDCLTVRSVHVDVDGELADFEAALFENYSDVSTHEKDKRYNDVAKQPKGSLKVPLATLTSFTSIALESGYQFSAETSGDLAGNAVLTAYSVALKNNRVKDHRLRIQGIEVIRPNDILWMAELNVLGVIQPQKAINEMEMLESRLGPERILTAHTWQAFIDNEVLIAGGTNFPDGSASPLKSFYTAITRQDLHSRPTAGWYPDQRLTRAQALKSLTLDGAYASFEDDIKGSIQVGKWADLVLLSKDIMTVPANDILSTKVLATMVGGSVTHMDSSYKN